MMVEIVPMAREHLDQAAALEERCFPEDPWSRRLFEEALESENTAALVARTEDGAVMGYLVCTVILDEGNVDNIAVAPEVRRQGVARSLLEVFHGFARETGLRWLTLEVRPSNEGAVSLYREMGYAEAGRRKNYYRKPREDAIIMRLELLSCT